MDKNAQKLKIEEIKSALHDRDYDGAARIADALDIKKIKDNNLLNLMADVYELNNNYEAAKKVLLTAYDNTSTGRHIAYKLCLLSIKTKDFAAAKDYYEDFVEMAPRDTSRYVLKYRMAKAQEKPIEELIVILEEYVNLDMEEKWAYELAKLYHMIGDRAKCVDICDEICLWFAEGKYVYKAMDLKKMYSPLTPAQQEKYDEKKRKIAEEAKEAEKKAKELKPFEAKIDIAQDIPEIKIEPEIAEEDIQAVVADGMREILGENKDETLEEIVKETAEKPVGLGETKIFGQENGNSDNLGETKIFGKMNGDMEEIIFQPVSDETKKEESSIKSKEIEEPVIEIEASDEHLEGNVDISLTEIKEDISKTEEPQIDIKADKDMKEEMEKEGQQEVISDSLEKEAVETVDSAETEAAGSQEETETINSPQTENVETISDIDGVADILRQLQARGILKAETVEQAVNIIDEATAARDELEEASKEEESEVSSRAEEKEIEPEDAEEEVVAPEAVDEETVTSQSAEKDIADENIIIEETKEAVEEKVTEEPETVAQEPVSETPVFDLGFATEELPTTEELSKEMEKEEKPSEEQVAENKNIQLKVKNASSAKVEIISGAGIVEEGELEIPESVEEEPKADEEVKEEPEEVEETSAEPEKEEATVEPVKEEAERKQKPLYNEEMLPIESARKEEQAASKVVLTEEDLAAFKNYLNVEGFETNIKDVLQDLIVNYTPNGKSSEGNIIIMGSEKTGKTTLAIEIVKLVNSKRGRRNRKLAKVNATALNRRGFRSVLNKLLGSDLIIENAELLGPMTLSEITDASGMFTDDMIIILEGEIQGMTKIINESQRVSQVFNHVITVRDYDVKEWVEYGKRYAAEKGYSLDELANLAFYKAIDDFFGANKGIGRNDVESIVDNAIAKSSRLGRKLTGIFASKKDDEGLNILVESDFNV